MGNRKILLVNSYKDMQIASNLVRHLSANEIDVDTLADFLTSGLDWKKQTLEFIRDNQGIIFFVSVNSIKNDEIYEEMKYAANLALNRDKKIISIVEKKAILMDFPEFNELLQNHEMIILNEILDTEEKYHKIAEEIYSILLNTEKKELLYEKITNLSGNHYDFRVVANLTELLFILFEELDRQDNLLIKRKIYKEILVCLVKLSECSFQQFLSENSDRVNLLKEIIVQIDTLFDKAEMKKPDLFYSAVAIKINYLDYIINKKLIDYRIKTLIKDTTTVQSFDEENYYIRQNIYLDFFRKNYSKEEIDKLLYSFSAEDEVEDILKIEEYILSDNKTELSNIDDESIYEPIVEKEEKLKNIAEYLNECNKLFELFEDDISTAGFLNCMKTSYERLKNYSEIVGSTRIGAECVERIAEINKKIELITESDYDDCKAEAGIKALLGYNNSKMDNFDVFLSYKHEDYDIAMNVYHFLQSKLINTFFDKITLPEMSDSEYEEAIMNGLDISKHFIVVASNIDYLSSQWVSLEMKVFNHEMVEGRKRGSNFIIIVTDEVFEKIRLSNKECLPIKYRMCEIMKISGYKSVIEKYLKV